MLLAGGACLNSFCITRFPSLIVIVVVVVVRLGGYSYESDRAVHI
jgi:hypothetical protein